MAKYIKEGLLIVGNVGNRVGKLVLYVTGDFTIRDYNDDYTDIVDCWLPIADKISDHEDEEDDEDEIFKRDENSNNTTTLIL